ncbi:hypothetical protein [Alkalimarinus alittae]|uniref:Uncharacterized protein n=1 Tax=Alkalimarinus alittae TaxID=2961619 RepID=A0ABY6N4B1_9ALTE|nr:hypothetical protein [Alkalimarinus alittae]UZE96827.1 hypothetical protein NKI27_03480 [Alkalimarinus alittae]
MSLPATNITCNACHYSGSTGVAFGLFKYQTPCGNITLPRDLGWCNTCKSVAAIEDTDQAARYESLKDDISGLASDLAEEIEKAKRSRPLLRRLFSKQKPDNDEIRLIRASLACLNEELANPSVLASYLRSERGAKCLSCGSSEVFIFPQIPAGIDSFYSEERTPEAIGIKHPGCGGELYATTSELRLNIRLTEKRYSLDGERIS